MDRPPVVPDASLGSAPRGRFGSLRDSLTLRLFVLLLGIVVIVFSVHGWITTRTTSQQWMDFLEQSAARTSELIKRGTYYGMLLNRKEEVHGTLAKIAQTPDVAAVRIYDKRGTIIFSTEPREIGRRVDRQADACVSCHEASQPLRALTTEKRLRVYRGPDGGRILGVISAIENHPECSDNACHAHRSDQTILGVLDVMMSMRYVDERIAAMSRQNLLSSLVMILVIGGASALFIWRVVRRPVGRLIAGTQRIAQGDLDTRLAVDSRDELGLLAASFNRMTDDLRRARQELTDWSVNLEKKVVEKTEELSRAQRQIIQMEKMSSLGKLATTVAHELNNPLAGILTYSKLVARDLGEEGFPPEERDEIARYLDLIQKESRRCGDIVRNLLLFARPSGGEFALQEINPILARAAMLIHHHSEMAGIQVQTIPLDGDDRVVCDADQLQQALVALLVNATEAMPGGGTLTVRADGDADRVRIRVADTGIGIAPELIPRIFEPFFSTKEGGTGVGLGLAVVYGIVQRHGGTIEVDSEVGRGTTFTVVLRRRQQAEGAASGGVAAAAGMAP